MTLKWLLVLGALCVAGQSQAGEQQDIKTPKDKLNYSIGVSTIRNYKQYGNVGDIDLTMVLQGMKDELSGKQLLMSEKELRAVLTAIQAEIMQKKRTARALASMPSPTASGEKSKETP